MTDLKVVLGSLEQRGAWNVPQEVTVSVMWGNAALDLREATLLPGLTTIHAGVRMGTLEVIVPRGVPVEMHVTPMLANVESHVRTLALLPGADEELLVDPYRDAGFREPSRIRIVGTVALANLEVHEAA
jgi:predicted membrane protein